LVEPNEHIFLEVVIVPEIICLLFFWTRHRQIIRTARRLSKFPESSLFDAIESACLTRFLPSLAKGFLYKILREHGITPITGSISEQEKVIISIHCLIHG